MSCPYCNITTSGEHEYGCPLGVYRMKEVEDLNEINDTKLKVKCPDLAESAQI